MRETKPPPFAPLRNWIENLCGEQGYQGTSQTSSFGVKTVLKSISNHGPEKTARALVETWKSEVACSGKPVPQSLLIFLSDLSANFLAKPEYFHLEELLMPLFTFEQDDRSIYRSATEASTEAAIALEDLKAKTDAAAEEAKTAATSVEDLKTKTAAAADKAKAAAAAAGAGGKSIIVESARKVDTNVAIFLETAVEVLKFLDFINCLITFACACIIFAISTRNWFSSKEDAPDAPTDLDTSPFVSALFGAWKWTDSGSSLPGTVSAAMAGAMPFAKYALSVSTGYAPPVSLGLLALQSTAGIGAATTLSAGASHLHEWWNPPPPPDPYPYPKCHAFERALNNGGIESLFKHIVGSAESPASNEDLTHLSICIAMISAAAMLAQLSDKTYKMITMITREEDGNVVKIAWKWVARFVAIKSLLDTALH